MQCGATDNRSLQVAIFRANVRPAVVQWNPGTPRSHRAAQRHVPLDSLLSSSGDRVDCARHEVTRPQPDLTRTHAHRDRLLLPGPHLRHRFRRLEGVTSCADTRDLAPGTHMTDRPGRCPCCPLLPLGSTVRSVTTACLIRCPCLGYLSFPDANRTGCLVGSWRPALLTMANVNGQPLW